jgi:hypothetical protein
VIVTKSSGRHRPTRSTLQAVEKEGIVRLDRRSLLSGLVGGVIAAVILAALPALAGNGDPMILGTKNHARRVTKLIGKNGLEIRASKNIPLRLFAQDGVPPLQVNQEAWVQHLNADLVDGFGANELIRAAYDHVDNVDEGTLFASQDYGEPVSAWITTPGAGMLMITAGINANSGAHDTWGCVLGVGGSYVPGTRRDIVNEDAGGTHTAANESDCATSGVMEVGAGDHWVWLRAFGWDVVDLREGSLMVLFVPFDGTGTVPIH